MFNSSMLDIVVGVVFIFLLLSIFATAINEVALSLLNKRGKYLLQGIRTLLSDDVGKGHMKPDGNTGAAELVEKIYNHGQVFGLYKGPFKPKSWFSSSLPSYIPSRNFALAFLDSVAQPFSEMKAAPAQIAPPPGTPQGTPVGPTPTITAQFKMAAQTLAGNAATAKVGIPLLSMIAMAGDDAGKLQTSVEAWFNSGMDRVSGAYKYRTQSVLLYIGLGIAILTNADTIGIVRQLSNDATLRQSIVAAAATPPSQGHSADKTDKSKEETPKEDTPKEDTSKADAAAPDAPAAEPGGDLDARIKTASDAFKDVHQLGIPLGWSKQERDKGYLASIKERPSMVIGWLFTAIAISLGAPFWFDALNKIMIIRSTVKPREKSHDEGSKDRTKD